MTDHSPGLTPDRSLARVETPNARSYLQQMCSHFAHKLEVHSEDTHGTITFGAGRCVMDADDGRLRLSLSASDGEAMTRLREVVASHLIRFAFREDLRVDWYPAPAAGPVSEHALDDRVQAVLDRYHRRMEDERAGTPAPDGPDQRMRAVGPDTGRFLNTLARGLDRPRILELGTSFGYSGIWLAEAARASGGSLVTMEAEPHKSAHARRMSEAAGLAGHVDFLTGDALALIAAQTGRFDVVFLDLWKDLYVPCLDAFYPLLAPGAVIVADNMIRPGGDHVRRYGQEVRRRPGISSVLLPIGTGLEVSRYEPS